MEAILEEKNAPSRPKYVFPWLPRFPFAFDLLFGRRRSFVHDSGLVMATNPYPRRFEGFEQLPQDSIFVVVANHFNRPGMHPYHCAMATSVAVATRRPGRPELGWLFTSEWYGVRFGPLPIPVGFTRWFFRRIARVYDFVVLPRREEMVGARALSLRQVLSMLRRKPIAITPEAGGYGQLREPPEGSGLFLAILSGRGYPLYPLAVFEEDSTLVLRLGAPFSLSMPRDVPRDEADRRAREKTMVAIGRLLPREYWGVYAAEIEKSLSDRGAAPA